MSHKIYISSENKEYMCFTYRQRGGYWKQQLDKTARQQHTHIGQVGQKVEKGKLSSTSHVVQLFSELDSGMIMPSPTVICCLTRPQHQAREASLTTGLPKRSRLQLLSLLLLLLLPTRICESPLLMIPHTSTQELQDSI